LNDEDELLTPGMSRSAACEHSSATHEQRRTVHSGPDRQSRTHKLNWSWRPAVQTLVSTRALHHGNTNGMPSHHVETAQKNDGLLPTAPWRATSLGTVEQRRTVSVHSGGDLVSEAVW